MLPVADGAFGINEDGEVNLDANDLKDILASQEEHKAMEKEKAAGSGGLSTKEGGVLPDGVVPDEEAFVVHSWL